MQFSVAKNQFIVQYGTKQFLVILELSERKQIAIVVYPDLRVIVKAPLNVSMQRIKNHVNKKGNWVAYQLLYFERFGSTVIKSYFNGESHYYKGKQYRLSIRQGKRAKVELKDRFFQMELPDPNDRRHAKIIMQKWDTAAAKEVLSRQVDISNIKHYLIQLKVLKPEFRFKKMRKSWGRCDSKSGIITLNTVLVKAPLSCIESVIVHELCHLVYPSHSRAFYSKMEELLPGWCKIRAELEVSEYVADIL